MKHKKITYMYIFFKLYALKMRHETSPHWKIVFRVFGAI